MIWYFYINAAIAVVATALTITARNAVHALLYFIVSLLAVSVSMYMLGAPFAAALEVIIYAGAIMVLFLFVVMLLNVVPASSQKHHLESWVGPIGLSILLVGELALMFSDQRAVKLGTTVVTAKEVAISLFTTYGLLVELTSFLLLAGLVGAYHVGKKGGHHGHSS